jgi:hypothetical protein
MKPSELYEALHTLIGERVPLHIRGACGAGKSQIAHQVANDLGYNFFDVRAVQLDPADLCGLPRISADQTEWVPSRFLPPSGKDILFLDELTSAPQMKQAGCYQRVLDRRLGEPWPRHVRSAGKADCKGQVRAGEPGVKPHGNHPRSESPLLDTSPPGWLHASSAFDCNQMAADASNH